MDPDELLTRLRALIEQDRNTSGHLVTGEVRQVHEALELFTALDDWLSRGGSHPPPGRRRHRVTIRPARLTVSARPARTSSDARAASRSRADAGAPARRAAAAVAAVTLAAPHADSADDSADKVVGGQWVSPSAPEGQGDTPQVAGPSRTA